MQNACARVADVHHQRRDLEALDEAPRRLGVALDAKGEDTTGGIAQKVFANAAAVRIALEAGIDDPLDLRMGAEKFGQRQSVGAVAFNAQVQCLQSEVEEEGVERAQAAAEMGNKLEAEEAAAPSAVA